MYLHVHAIKICHIYYFLPLGCLLLDESTPSTVSKLYAEVYLGLTTYWIVVVLGAFLVVILVGQPSVLKTVYLVFLYVFFLIYQVSNHLYECISQIFLVSLFYFCLVHYKFPFFLLSSLSFPLVVDI